MISSDDFNSGGIHITVPRSFLHPFLQSACYVGHCGRSALLSFRAFSLTWPSAMQIQLPQHWFGTPIWPPWRHMKTLSLTWPRAIQIYWNKRKRLHKIKFQPLEDWFGTPTWPAVSLFWDTNMADVTSLENAVLFRNRFILRFLAINYSWELALVDFICYLLPLPSRKKKGTSSPSDTNGRAARRAILVHMKSP